MTILIGEGLVKFILIGEGFSQVYFDRGRVIL